MPLFLHDGKLHGFMHVPKAAGSSVERWLVARFGVLAFLNGKHFRHPSEQRWVKTSPQHVTARDLALVVPRRMLGRTFAVTRHPFGRLRSAYLFAVAQKRIPSVVTLEEWFRDYRRSAEWRPFAFDNHLRPQVDFHFGKTRSFRLEDGFDEVLLWLERKYGPPSSEPETTHANRGTRTGSEGDEGPAAAQIEPSPGFADEVADFYAADFERFGYEPGPASMLRYPAPSLLGARARWSRQRLRYDAVRVLHRADEAFATRSPLVARWRREI